MSKKRTALFAVAMSMFFAFCSQVSAMHIAEGYLNPVWCISWGVLCIPSVFFGINSLIKKTRESSKYLVLLALCGAFALVLSSLKLPSVTGSSSHPTGVGLSAMLFGPSVSALIGLIVLLFQALLLAHGGITTLGANLFSMGIAGPLVSFFTYKLMKKLKVNRSVCIFTGAALGNLFTYICTALQLALDHSADVSFAQAFVKFLGVFAVTQIPLAVCEGLLTVVIFSALEKYSYKDMAKLSAL